MLLKKVKRRIKEQLTRVVYHNKQFRPKGFYRTIDDFTSATKNSVCQEIYPAYTSYLEVDQEFKSKFVKYVETTEVAQIPPARIVTIPNGRVHTDNGHSVAIISGDDKLIGELSFDLIHRELAENNIFKQTYFHEPVKYNGTVFSMLIGEGGIVNYSHFLNDSVARLHLLKKSGWYNKVDWFLVPSLKQDFQRDAIRMLGIDQKKVIAADAINHIQADTLIATTYVRYHEHIPLWCCQFLRDEFLKYQTEINNTTYPYVYISRNDAAKRRVLNEPELVQTLRTYGFESFELSKLSFQQKISLFANAKVVIATIGAGQANLVFCKPQTEVIELMADDFTQPFFNDLANKVNLNYDYLICKSDGHATTFKQGEKLNLTVNIKEIEKKLRNIFSAIPMVG